MIALIMNTSKSRNERSVLAKTACPATLFPNAKSVESGAPSNAADADAVLSPFPSVNPEHQVLFPLPITCIPSL